MKRLSILGLLLVIVLILTGCGSNGNSDSDETKDKSNKKQGKTQIEESYKELNIGKSQDFAFGTFSIIAFKRDGNVLYYGVEIDPLDKAGSTIELNNLKYYIGDSSHQINKETIQLNGEVFQHVYTIDSDSVAKINAISLDYKGIKAKWNLDINANASGDVDSINNSNQTQEQSSNSNQTNQETTQVEEHIIHSQLQDQSSNYQDEVATLNQAWRLLDGYGEEFYPEGFKLNYNTDKYAEERGSDGVWFLQAGCEVTNENGEVLPGICEAEVQRVNNGWEILSFEVY